MSQIITFYSYKGGVGRTMSLANIAVLLSSWGKRVLIIDWDLEAPGLEHFFNDFFDISTVKERLGIIDLLDNDAKIIWQDMVIPIQINNDRHPIHFISAGKRDENYFAKVRNFNVEFFYENGGGQTIEDLREQWKTKYDFVLVDSRTGITEIGGICTVQLPDQLVLLFTATEQGFSGTLDIAKRALAAQQRLPYDRQKMVFIPVLTKFDTQTEFKLSQQWLDKFAEGLAFIYQDWLPLNLKPREFLEATKVPYVPYFSFGEKLPVLEQSANDATGLTYAYENVAALISNQLNDVNALFIARDRYINGSDRTEPSTFSKGRKIKVFISYSHLDKGMKDLLMMYLSVFGLKYNIEFWSADQVSIGTVISEEINDRLEQSDLFIALVSENYLNSTWAQIEVDMAISEKKNILPILLSQAPWSLSKLSRYQFFPQNMLPLDGHQDLEEIFSQLADELEKIIQQIEQQPKVEICVVTPYAEDLAVVTDYFKLNGTLNEKYGKNKATRFIGRLKDKGGAEVNVSCSLLPRSNQKFSDYYTSLEKQFSPQFIVMLTRAAAVERFYEMGDVLLPDKIVDLSQINLDRYRTKDFMQILLNVRISEMISGFQIANRNSSPLLIDGQTNVSFRAHSGAIAVSSRPEPIEQSIFLNNQLSAITAGIRVEELLEIRKRQSKAEFMLISQITEIINEKKDEKENSISHAMQLLAEVIKTTYIY